MIQNGTLIIVEIGGIPYSGQTGGSFDEATDQIDTTTKDSTDGAKEMIGGEYGGTISVEGLLDLNDTSNAKLLLDAAIARTVATATWGTTIALDAFWTADVLISSVSLTNPKNEAGGYSAELQITGVITEGANPA